MGLVLSSIVVILKYVLTYNILVKLSHAVFESSWAIIPNYSTGYFIRFRGS